ncbi:MAG: phospholipid carrier-dependent glycosyltransferase, partial [Nanoarchaeota archaeon]
KYVSIEKTVLRPQYHGFQYMDPYPPVYDMTLGVLAQTSSSVYWTVKFFNALLIALSLVFFYFFAKEFVSSRNKALFATFVLASIPAYLSHFIWAPALAMAVFPQTMYAFEMIKHDRKWLLVAGVGFASILLAHPTHAFKLSALIFIYIAIKAFSDFVSDKKSWLSQNISHIKAVFLGLVLSLFWWALKWKAFVSMAKGGFTGGPEAAATAIRDSPNIIAKILTLITRVFNPHSGTASRVYSLQDFVVAHSANLINNPIGLGVVVSLLALAGILSAVAAFSRFLPKPVFSVSAVLLACLGLTGMAFGVSGLQVVLASILSAFILSLVAIIRSNKGTAVPLSTLGSSSGEHGEHGKRRKALVVFAIVLGWLLFTFLGVNNQTFNLQVGLFAFRFWMIFTIPVALIAAEGFFSLLSAVNLFKLDKTTA